MPIDTDDSLPSTVTHWLAQFEAALAGSDAAGLAALFTPAAHWRDLLALTWDVKTVSGAASVVDLLLRHGQGAGQAEAVWQAGRAGVRPTATRNMHHGRACCLDRGHT